MRARVVWLVLCAIWGSTWLFIKIGLQYLPPVTFAGIRFVIASLILLLIVFIRHRPIPRRRADWLLIAVTGVQAFAINYGLIFWGEQHISSGLAALLQTTIPAFGLVIAHVHLPSERMTFTKVFGVILGIAGVGIIFSNQLSSEGPLALWGSAAIVTGAFSAAYANVLVKARGGHLDPAMLASGQMFFGLIPLLIVGISTEGNPLYFHWTGMAVVALLYLVLIGSVIAFLLYYWLVRNMDVTKTMLIALVTPLFAVTLGMIVLDERLSWRTLLGGACIMSGIGLIVLRRIKESDPVSVPQVPHEGSDSA
ncbi:MAG TPA: EamA family transporter [Pyrinomonadaceae bacterium]|jgi:drug/metabolite transporter (DMT)-like permease|nr:EamA family transporter [Pyrinomonadaceae bacterium]